MSYVGDHLVFRKLHLAFSLKSFLCTQLKLLQNESRRCLCRLFFIFQVEIIANDQGNRTTPSYVAFTDTERLIGDAAKNQVGPRTIKGTIASKFFVYTVDVF